MEEEEEQVKKKKILADMEQTGGVASHRSAPARQQQVLRVKVNGLPGQSTGS